VFNLPSLKVGRIFGIPVEINPTWLVIFVLVAASLGFSYFPAYYDWPTWLAVLNGALTALLFFASIVVHEMSHSLVARTGGIKIRKVTLFLFGGVAQMEEEPKGPGREFVMAAAGPGASLVLSALFYILYVGARSFGVSDVLWAPLEYLALINLSVAVFNLLPGFPLDGGRVLRAILWGITGDVLKATLWASRAGQVIGYSMVAVAVIGVLNGQLNLIWFGLVGWFIAVLADNAFRQQAAKSRMSNVPVAAIMTPEPTVAPGEITLEQLAHDYFLGGRHSRYPVVVNGSVVGLVSLAGVKRVPREDWPATRVLDVAETDMSTLIVEADASVDEVMDRLAGERPGAVLAVRDGRVVGIVTRADVVSRLQRADI